MKKNKSIPLFHGVYRASSLRVEREPFDATNAQTPDAAALKLIWDSHWRPNAVFCITCSEKLLLCFSSEYELWQLPQGGVEPGETLEEALVRELGEELGEDFASKCHLPSRFLGRDRIDFPARTLVTVRRAGGDAEEVSIKGKVYFFSHIAAAGIEMNLEQSQFDDYQWCNYQDAYEVLDALCQSGKRRVSLKALEHLKRQSLVA